MPKKLTTEWAHVLGLNSEAVHKKWLDTPGNLTITNYNGELGQKPFSEKRKIYKDSNFGLTKNLYQHNLLLWGGLQIEERGKKMADMAKNIWIGPFA